MTLPARSAWLSIKQPPVGRLRINSAAELLGPVEESPFRSGALVRWSPVARFTACDGGGVVVSNATASQTRLTSKGGTAKGPPITRSKTCGIGDWVQCTRRRCFPKIADVDLFQTTEDADPFVYPTRCPNAGHDAIREKRPRPACTGGLICPAQAVEKLETFRLRGAFDIVRLGRETQVETVSIRRLGRQSRG